jgi:hypothetical protein
LFKKVLHGRTGAQWKIFGEPFLYGKGKIKGKGRPRTGYESPEEE